MHATCDDARVMAEVSPDMARHFIRLLPTLLTAAAATVATAWIGSLAFRPDRAIWTESPQTISTALVRRELHSRTRMSDRAGWPLAAMGCEYELDSSPRGELFARAVHAGVPVDLPPPVAQAGMITIRSAAAHARAIPLRPLPVGFLINAAIYFVVIQATVFATAVFARLRAIARHSPSRST